VGTINSSGRDESRPYDIFAIDSHLPEQSNEMKKSTPKRAFLLLRISD